MSLEDARQTLAAARSEYQRKLRGVDRRLAAAVAQDPSRIPEAREIQDGYGGRFEAATFSVNEQPVVPEEHEGTPIESQVKEVVVAAKRRVSPLLRHGR
jgi:hypothetical protein